MMEPAANPRKKKPSTRDTHSGCASYPTRSESSIAGCAAFIPKKLRRDRTRLGSENGFGKGRKTEGPMNRADLPEEHYIAIEDQERFGSREAEGGWKS